MCALDMDVTLANQIMSVSAAGPSAAQPPKPSNPEAPNEVGKGKPHKDSQTPADKALNAGEVDNPVAVECPAPVQAIVDAPITEAPAFSTVLHAALADGNPLQVQAGGDGIVAQALAPFEAGRPEITQAGAATPAAKDVPVSLPVRPATPAALVMPGFGGPQVISRVHQPITAGQPGDGAAASEVAGKPIGPARLNAEGIALPSPVPIKITEALAEAISSGIDAAGQAGKSQAGFDATEVNPQLLTSPGGPAIEALVGGMKQVSAATGAPAVVVGKKGDVTASAVTGRNVASAKSAGPVGAAKSAAAGAAASDGRTAAQIEPGVLHRGGGGGDGDKLAGPVVRVRAGQADPAQDLLPQTGVAAEAPRLGAVDAPTVAAENSLPASATNQIVEALQTSAARGGQQVVIRLNPPELGRVSIMLNADGNEVRGVLRVDNPQTLSQLQREAPALLGRLADAGIQLRQMDLSLSQQGSNDSALYSQLRDESGLWSGGGQGRDLQTSADELVSDEPVLAGAEEPRPGPIAPGDGAINVWI